MQDGFGEHNAAPISQMSHVINDTGGAGEEGVGRNHLQSVSEELYTNPHRSATPSAPPFVTPRPHFIPHPVKPTNPHMVPSYRAAYLQQQHVMQPCNVYQQQPQHGQQCYAGECTPGYATASVNTQQNLQHCLPANYTAVSFQPSEHAQFNQSQQQAMHNHQQQAALHNQQQHVVLHNQQQAALHNQQQHAALHNQQQASLHNQQQQALFNQQQQALHNQQQQALHNQQQQQALHNQQQQTLHNQQQQQALHNQQHHSLQTQQHRPIAHQMQYQTNMPYMQQAANLLPGSNSSNLISQNVHMVGNVISQPRANSRCDSVRSEAAESSCSSMSTDSQLEHSQYQQQFGSHHHQVPNTRVVQSYPLTGQYYVNSQHPGGSYNGVNYGTVGNNSASGNNPPGIGANTVQTFHQVNTMHQVQMPGGGQVQIMQQQYQYLHGQNVPPGLSSGPGMTTPRQQMSVNHASGQAHGQFPNAIHDQSANMNTVGMLQSGHGVINTFDSQGMPRMPAMAMTGPHGPWVKSENALASQCTNQEDNCVIPHAVVSKSGAEYVPVQLQQGMGMIQQCVPSQGVMQQQLRPVGGIRPSMNSLQSAPNSSVLMDTVVVPFGWRRIITNGHVTYVSPSGTELRNCLQVSEYLKTEGTCKCGLQCPLRVELTFSFHPEAPCRATLLAEVCGENLAKLCNHRRKLAAAFTDHLNSKTRKVTENVKKKRKRKTTETVSDVDSGVPHGVPCELPAMAQQHISQHAQQQIPYYPQQQYQQPQMYAQQSMLPRQGWNSMGPRMANPSAFPPMAMQSPQGCTQQGYNHGHTYPAQPGYQPCCEGHRYPVPANGQMVPMMRPGFPMEQPMFRMVNHQAMGSCAPLRMRGPVGPNNQMIGRMPSPGMMPQRMSSPGMIPSPAMMPQRMPSPGLISGPQGMIGYTNMDGTLTPVDCMSTENDKKRKPITGVNRSRKKLKSCPSPMEVNSSQTVSATNIEVHNGQAEPRGPMGGHYRGPPISSQGSKGPSFMEDPNGYLAQQTALLNNTMAGGGIGQFSPQAASRPVRQVASPVPSTGHAGIGPNGAHMVPLPSNVPLPSRVCKAGNGVSVATNESPTQCPPVGAATPTPPSEWQSGRESQGEYEYHHWCDSKGHDGRCNDVGSGLGNSPNCGSDTCVQTDAKSNMNSIRSTQCVRSEEKRTRPKNSPTGRSSKSNKAAVKAAPASVPEANVTSSSSPDKPLTPGPPLGIGATQSPLEMVQNIVSSIPVHPASPITSGRTMGSVHQMQQHMQQMNQQSQQMMNQQSQNMTQHMSQQLQHISQQPQHTTQHMQHMSNVMPFISVPNQGPNAGLMYATPTMVRGPTPLIVSSAPSMPQNVLVNSVSASPSMVVVSTPFTGKANVMGMSTGMNQMPHFQPMVQLVNTFSTTMQTPVIIQNHGGNLIQSPILHHNHGGTAWMGHAVGPGLTMEGLVTTSDLGGDFNRVAPPQGTPRSTVSTPQSTPGSSDSSSSGTSNASGKRKRRRRNASTPISSPPATQGVMLAVNKISNQIPRRGQAMPGYNAIAPLSSAPHQLAQVATMGGNHQLLHTSQGAINVVQMMGPQLHHPSAAILVGQAAPPTPQGLVINQLPDGTFVSTDPHTGISYPVQLQLAGGQIVGVTHTGGGISPQCGVVGSFAAPTLSAMVTVRPPAIHHTNLPPGTKMVNMSPSQVVGQIAQTGPVQLLPMGQHPPMGGPTQVMIAQAEYVGGAESMAGNAATMVGGRKASLMRHGGSYVTCSTQTFGESDVSSSDGRGRVPLPVPVSPLHQSAEVTTTRQDEDATPPSDGSTSQSPPGGGKEGRGVPLSTAEEVLNTTQTVVVWGSHRGHDLWPAQLLHQAGGSCVVQWYGDKQVDAVDPSLLQLFSCVPLELTTFLRGKGRSSLGRAVSAASMDMSPSSPPARLLSSSGSFSSPLPRRAYATRQKETSIARRSTRGCQSAQ